MLDIVAKLSGKFNAVFSARQHDNNIMLSRAKTALLRNWLLTTND